MIEDDLGIGIGREHDMKFVKTFNLMWPHACVVVNRLNNHLGDCSLNDEITIVEEAVTHARGEVMCVSKNLAFECNMEEVMICSFLSGLAAVVHKLASWRIMDDSGQMWNYQTQSYTEWASGRKGIKITKVTNIEASPDWVLNLMLTERVRNNLGEEVLQDIRTQVMNHGF